MLSVKIGFYPLDWYSSSLQQLFYTTECICIKCFQAIAKSSKKENAIYIKYVLHRLRHIELRKRRDSLVHVRPILGKTHVT